MGLRHKRACFVLTLVLLCGLATLITTIYAALIIQNLDMDAKGPRGMVVKSEGVGFLKPVEITGQVFLQGSETVLRAVDGIALLLTGSVRVR